MNHAFVVPVHGRADLLGNCLDSIRDQSAHGSAIVIGTSTPSETITQVAAQFGLSVLVNPISSGIASDWNFVLRASKADYITIAHQDDIYAPEYLERLLQLAQRHPRFLMAFSNYREHTTLGRRPDNLNLKIKRRLCELAFRHGESIETTAAKKRLLNLGNPVCCPSVMLNRSLLPDFEFETGFKSNLDWDAWLRLAEVPGAFLYDREFLISKGIHPASETSASIASDTRRKEDRQMFTRMWPSPIAAVLSLLYTWGYRGNRTDNQ